MCKKDEKILSNYLRMSKKRYIFAIEFREKPERKIFIYSLIKKFYL